MKFAFIARCNFDARYHFLSFPLLLFPNTILSDPGPIISVSCAFGDDLLNDHASQVPGAHNQRLAVKLM